MESTTAPDLREIVRRLGGEIYNGGKAATVPGPPPHSRGDRSLSLRLSEDGKRVLWFSHAGDPAARVWPYLDLPDTRQGERLHPREVERMRRQRDAEDRAERARKLTYCQRIWSDTHPAVGSPVEAYLRGRGVTGAIPSAVRFHPAAPLAYVTRDRPNPPTFPAMVAMAMDPKGEPCGLHVTALKPDGSGKADLKNARVMFGDLAGAAVRLSPIPDGGELGVAEGIETALSYRDLTGTPTWAALSTAGLRRFEPPRSASRLIVAADSDDKGAGIEAAKALAERVSRRCDCSVIPAPEGQDWNDVAKGAR